MNDMLLRYKAISLFRGTAEVLLPLFELADGADDVDALGRAARVFSLVAEHGCGSTGELIDKLLERDDNCFSRSAAKAERIPVFIKRRAEAELLTFKLASLLDTEQLVGACARAYAPIVPCGGMTYTYDRLCKFYRKNGCGELAASDAFIYDGELKPVEVDSVRLSDLKNYAEEKAEIVKNTENFINGLPAFHTLLYGDRGTGKSSTVRALANEYRGRLKVIELKNERIAELRQLLRRIDGMAQKYILFIDDLSFDENDARVDGFKAALEGSLELNNALVYCTSNRRHLFKETDKQTRRNDDVQAELALFDRFGLVVTYVVPDKAEFIDILKQIVLSRGIKWREEYAQIAELAALKKGGRSPRAAKQIADLIETTYVAVEKR